MWIARDKDDKLKLFLYYKPCDEDGFFQSRTVGETVNIELSYSYPEVTYENSPVELITKIKCTQLSLSNKNKY